MKNIYKYSNLTVKIVTLLVLLLIQSQGLKASEPPQTAFEMNLTIETAKQTALENNPGIRQTLARIRSAKAILGQAYASWFPTISANGGYIHRHIDIQPDFDPFNRVKGDITETTGSLQLNWLLFNGLARRAETLAAKYGVEQAKQTYADTQRLLMESVATAYYQAQLARENIRIAEKNAAFNRELEKNAQIRRKVGTAPRSEMLNFSIRAIQAESDSIRADRDYTVARTVLAELMGIDKTMLSAELGPAPENAEITDAIPSYEQIITLALENRPDLSAVEAGINAAVQRKDAAKGSWFPTVNLTAGLNYDKQTGIDPDQEERNRYAGITARWDLFTGGKRSSVFQQKKAEVFALEAEKQQTILSIQSGIRQSIANAEAARKQWKRQESALTMTQQVRDDIELLYKTGSATLTRLNEAQTDLVRAQVLAASSKVEYLLALEKLSSETGNIPTLPTPEENIAPVE
ncbi:TolC family protein [Prosthecochloris sp.]|uniref:TolC family protein n=1 Tax=Prosthecochloris sp. TaxID=290513 RepID=UPI0025F5B9BA|nr:TolC family protein [Prosthecochloris sp.]